MKVRYNGPSEAFTIGEQTVGRGGVLTLNRERDMPTLRHMAAHGHRFEIVDDLPAEEQVAALEAAQAVVVPVEAIPVAVVASEPEIPGEAPEKAADEPKKRGK
jgi:hypothetical protein